MGRFISVSFGLLVLFLSLSGTGANCLPGWSVYEGRCYKVFNQRVNWTDAEKFCQEQPNGQHLASIDWLGKANFVAELVSESLKNYKYQFYVWIGLSDQSERQQCSSHWSDGSLVFYDGGVYSTKCFGLDEKTEYRTWVARPCGNTYPFICMSLVAP